MQIGNHKLLMITRREKDRAMKNVVTLYEVELNGVIILQTNNRHRSENIMQSLRVALTRAERQ
jgi:hypothetical protein